MSRICVKTVSAIAGVACIALQGCGASQIASTPKIDLGAACKKYISQIMGRPVASMKVDGTETSDGLVAISYIRDDEIGRAHV